MQVQIANGTLTTDHAASSYGQPVFVFNGVAHGMGDEIDLGDDALDFLRFPQAANHVKAAYFSAIDRDRNAVTVAEYNLIAKFCDLDQANA